MKSKTSSVWEGAMLLTAAALVVKILSVVYRIPYQNMTGDFGFYVFQQAYPFYAVGAAIAFTGFPMALSKMIATEKTINHHLIKTSFWTSFMLGIVSFIILYLTAPYIAGLMGDIRLSLPIRVISVLFLFIPFSAFFRGTYQGYGDMQLTAVSQLIEQTVRVSGILLLSFYFVKNGYSSYTTGAGAITGSVLGSVASGLFLLIFWKKGAVPPYNNQARFRVLYSVELLKSSIYLSLSALVLAMMQMVDAFLFVNLLIEKGMNAYDAKLLKGVFDRGQPLLQLGTVAAASIALAVVPEMASLMKQQRKEEIKSLTALSIKISFVFGGAAATGLICIMKPLNVMLFKNEEGSGTLAALCVSILFVSVIYTSTGLLQGMDYGRYAAVSILIAVFVKVVGNFIFIPIFGSTGAAISTVLSTFIAALLQFIKLQKATRFWDGRMVPVLSFIISIITMAITVKLWLLGGEALLSDNSSRKIASLLALSSSIVGAVVYLICFIKFKIFSDKEWESLAHSISIVRKITNRFKKGELK
jgi:PST family polysaccharide transporter